MTPILRILCFTVIMITCVSCKADKTKDPNIWVTLSESKSGKPVNGYYVYFKSLTDSRYDLVISTKPLVIRDDRLVNPEDVIVPDSISVFTAPNQWIELNYRKSSRSGISFVRARKQGFVEKFPIEVEFYDSNMNRKSLYLFKDLKMKKQFFPNQ